MKTGDLVRYRDERWAGPSIRASRAAVPDVRPLGIVVQAKTLGEVEYLVVSFPDLHEPVMEKELYFEQVHATR